ncbi:P-selectin-like [Sycon ciliatum]|uniref:P-selectin-like n=1 Tax=Sycon ciliatum TaxID=27933 RepID=UPI0031F6963B
MVANVTCNEGYEINGSRSVVCLESGKWSDTPHCIEIPTCAVLQIANGAFSEAQTQRVNSVAEVTCNTGYQINGSRSVVCLESGVWSDTPHCMVFPSAEQTAPTSTSKSSNIVPGVIGFLAGLIIPAALIIIYLARYRGTAKTISMTESDNAKPTAIFVSQLTENDAYEMTSTVVEANPEPEYETMSPA